MKAIAFSNNDMAIIAWTFDGRLEGCLGFAIFRTDVRSGVESCLPAMATFPGEDATIKGRTTATDPVQKFFWKDVYAPRGGSYRYRVVPMGGAPKALAPLATGAVTSNVVQLTPDLGVLSAYFNRGILATQATAKALQGAGDLDAMKTLLLHRIVNPDDQLRIDLAGEMPAALMTLPTEAAATQGDLFCALYEFEDQQLIGALDQVGKSAHVILSNMPGTDAAGAKTDDTYQPEREAAAKVVDVIDRMMPSGHIGHNKFTILSKGGQAQAVQFGSTNWTGRALCAQSNNTIIARSPKMAAAFKTYWDNLKADTDSNDGKGRQSAPLRDVDGAGVPTITLEDGSGMADIWFSPNTAHARQSGAARVNEAAPPDLAVAFDLISKAKQAILFVEFEPGTPSVIGKIAEAQRNNPGLFVRGTVTVAAAAEEFAVGIKSDAGGTGGAGQRDNAIPTDYRVIPATGVNDPTGQWEKELNKAGFAITHSKFVVIDPFSDDCVVMTGSHNQGYQASYNNDENLVIIKGHRALAEAYAANALDIYDHYAWRWWLAKNPDEAWTSLKTDASWQNDYFDDQNQPSSPELKFWLAATPSSDAPPKPALRDENRAVPDLTIQPTARKNRVSLATGLPFEQASEDGTAT